MISDFHFLRPLWLICLIPFMGLLYQIWKQPSRLHAWAEVCDRHLLEHMLSHKGQSKHQNSIFLIAVGVIFMIIAISGPTWHKYPVVTYKPILPRVIVLDMSDRMMETDLSPDRLSRAKFKLYDLLSRKNSGQLGLVVFTGEPFVVSPLTDDSQTIASLLSALTQDTMPVTGHNLESALNEANQLIHDAGYKQGDILVMTADAPTTKAIDLAKDLSKKGVYSSIMPMRKDSDLNPLFEHFATSGGGQLLKYSSESKNLEHWMSQGQNKEQLEINKLDHIPLWRDEGRWFLVPALLCLLPVFQRGWLQRIDA